MTKQVGACCSSPASICYWFIVSLMAWGVLSLIGIYWRPLHALPTVACLFAMAIGCLANWHRNRSFHCAITGPLFLIGGVIFMLFYALRRAHDPPRHALGVASPPCRRRRRVCAGMAVWEASCVLTVEKSPCSLLLASIPREERAVAPPAGGCHRAGMCYEEKCLESGYRGRIYHLPLLFQPSDGRI
jgi:hypothetical protein